MTRGGDPGARGDTFPNARLWDYRPLGDTLDQLQTVRQYYDFTDVDTDRYDVGEDYRQVMLSVRELALDEEPVATAGSTSGSSTPTASASRWSRSTRSRPRASRGSRSANLPPVSSQGAPPITEPRIYFGERPQLVRRRRRPPGRVRLPASARRTASRCRRTRWTGTTGIQLDTTLAGCCSRSASATSTC